MTAIVLLTGYRRIFVNVLAASAVVTVAGCAGRDHKPVNLNAAPKTVIVTGQPDKSASYVTPDGYPDLSKPLTAANTQMTNDDAKKQEDTLEALAAKRKKGQISEADYNRRIEEFRKLGQKQ